MNYLPRRAAGSRTSIHILSLLIVPSLALSCSDTGPTALKPISPTPAAQATTTPATQADTSAPKQIEQTPAEEATPTPARPKMPTAARRTALTPAEKASNRALVELSFQLAIEEIYGYMPSDVVCPEDLDIASDQPIDCMVVFPSDERILFRGAINATAGNMTLESIDSIANVADIEQGIAKMAPEALSEQPDADEAADQVTGTETAAGPKLTVKCDTDSPVVAVRAGRQFTCVATDAQGTKHPVTATFETSQRMQVDWGS
ncbi:MAG: hypothetical protein Tsb0020_15100 [Haliangiales bacterium]